MADVMLGEDFGYLVPKKAIVLYGQENKAVAYASEHGIVDGWLGAGKPLRLDLLERALRTLNGAAENLRWQDERVLAEGPGVIVWWEPAGERTLFFNPSGNDKVARRLRELSGKDFPQPPLVFMLSHHDLHVYALRENKRPRKQTALYYPPYWNVASANVCLGSTSMPDLVDSRLIDEYVGAFYASAFTHPWHYQTAYGGNHADMWNEALRSGSFDNNWLAPAGKTLEEAVEEFE